MPDAALLEAFVGHLSQHAFGPALRLARTVAGQDGADACVTDLLAAAQQEVGRRWEFGEWTVAQEHAATAIVDAAVAHLHLALDERSPGTGPHLALVCAEGEWHATPARMAAVRLLDRGWRVTFLGASTPADQLRRTLMQTRPDVLGVSCTLPVHLPGARRTVEVGHCCGLPVVVAGTALGPDARRARAIGADAGGGGLDELEPRMRRWLDRGAPDQHVAHAAHADEVAVLRQLRPVVVDRVLGTFQAPPASPDPDRWLARTREDLVWILRFAEVSLELDDGALFREFLSWLQGVLVVRGVPVVALAAGLDRLADALPDDLRATRDRLRAGHGWVVDGPSSAAGAPGL